MNDQGTVNDRGTSSTRTRGTSGREPSPAPKAEAILPFIADDVPNGELPVLSAGSDVLQFDFRPLAAPVRRILVLKLDHFGDFIIGLPAMRELRNTFPDTSIRLICGEWNLGYARDSGLFDEVYGFNYFPETPVGWDGEPADDMAVFDRATRGSFDLAIDLRVDEDTRHLLGRVNATARCGVGSKSRFPSLDIAFPAERSRRDSVIAAKGSSVFMPPAQFGTMLTGRTGLYREGPLQSLGGRPLIQGALPPVPAGVFSATVGLSIHRFVPGIRGCSLVVEIVRDEEHCVQSQVFGRTSLGRLGRAPLVLTFANGDPRSRYELRVRATGKPLAGYVRFWGVEVGCGEIAPSSRFPSVELHVGETLSLLVALIKQRATEIYPQAATLAPRSGERPARIVIAPFSNSSTRDWPVTYYSRLVTLLLERTDCEIALIGIAAQLAASLRISQQNVTPRLRNLIGSTDWAELGALLRESDLVICNNSGIAHLAASHGSPVLAIYSGSHQPQEWGPRGPLSHAVMRHVPCSPCGFERVEDCAFDHVCMRLIEPDDVLERALALLPDRNGLGVEVTDGPDQRAQAG